MAFLESSLPLSLDISVYKLHFDFYRNEAFIGRTYLAAIDHNTHVFRKNAVSATGKLKYNKVYSKRSKNHRIVPVKDPKTYDFWPTLATRIIQKRIDDDDSVHRRVEISEEHPKNIAPSISLHPIPKTDDLVKQSLSRFVHTSASANNVQQQVAEDPEPQTAT
jgi:hypothetical protein